MFRFRGRQKHQLLCFAFIVFKAVWLEGQICGCPSLHSSPSYDWDRFFFSLVFFTIQERWYLCVQILTNVYLCWCLSATVDGRAGFRILNKLLFSFHTCLCPPPFFGKNVVLPSYHMVSVELGTFNSFITMTHMRSNLYKLQLHLKHEHDTAINHMTTCVVVVKLRRRSFCLWWRIGAFYLRVWLQQHFTWLGNTTGGETFTNTKQKKQFISALERSQSSFLN